jgi:quinol monooxygenase YgiN
MEVHRRTFLGLSAAAMASPLLSRLDVAAQEASPGAVAAASLTVYLLTIRGTLAPATLEAARAIHNDTAGAPESVAAARALGDVSHMVYAPVAPAASGAGEVLFLDFWTSAEGLNRFFANPVVQEQAAQIFAERDPVVWEPAEGFLSYHLPSPYGQNDRFVVIVRGTVTSRDDARTLHNAAVAGGVNASGIAGYLSHDSFSRLTAPGEPQSLEFLAMDVWKSTEGLQDYYAAPELQSAFASLFATAPTVSVWTHAAGDWVEW